MKHVPDVVSPAQTIGPDLGKSLANTHTHTHTEPRFSTTRRYAGIDEHYPSYSITSPHYYNNTFLSPDSPDGGYIAGVRNVESRAGKLEPPLRPLMSTIQLSRLISSTNSSSGPPPTPLPLSSSYPYGFLTNFRLVLPFIFGRRSLPSFSYRWRYDLIVEIHAEERRLPMLLCLG